MNGTTPSLETLPGGGESSCASSLARQAFVEFDLDDIFGNERAAKHAICR
jgi:hypothetical protein